MSVKRIDGATDSNVGTGMERHLVCKVWVSEELSVKKDRWHHRQLDSFQKSNIGWPQQPLTERTSDIS
jgi:precorrin-6B methylase 1